MLGILLINIASAALLGPFKQGEDIELIQTCPDCTYNNITYIQKPDGTLLNFNVEMDKDGTFYNWTLNSSYANLYGVYFINGFGDLGGTATTWVYDIEVTSTGEGGKSFLLNPILIFLTIFAFTFVGLGMALKIPSLGFIGSILLVLAGMYTMIYGFGDVANLYTRGIAISLLGLGFIFMISSAYEWLAWGEDE